VPGLVLPLMEFAGVRHVVLEEPAAHRTMAVVRAAARPLSPIAAAFVAALTDPAGARPELPQRARWLERDAERPGPRRRGAGPS
jgi:LysR family carnitine catabolism transcriptional activator